MTKIVTVKDLVLALSDADLESEVTFGSSTHRKCPLIFYRFKRSEDNLLQIELNELERNDEPTPEHEYRKTVKFFLDYLSGCPENMEITFGSTIDACPLDFGSITKSVSFNLVQTEKPEWFVREDT